MSLTGTLVCSIKNHLGTKLDLQIIWRQSRPQSWKDFSYTSQFRLQREVARVPINCPWSDRTHVAPHLEVLLYHISPWSHDNISSSLKQGNSIAELWLGLPPALSARARGHTLYEPPNPPASHLLCVLLSSRPPEGCVSLGTYHLSAINTPLKCLYSLFVFVHGNDNKINNFAFLAQFFCEQGGSHFPGIKHIFS